MYKLCVFAALTTLALAAPPQAPEKTKRGLGLSLGLSGWPYGGLGELDALHAAPYVSHAPIISPAPVISHSPIISHAPLYGHAAPIYSPAPIIRSAPIYSPAPIIRSAPLISHAPLYSHAAPFYGHAAPLSLGHAW